MISGFMEPVEARKFVMFRAWQRIEAFEILVVNDIPETFYYIRFEVEIRKLHV